MSSPDENRLGSILLRAGLINEEQLATALARQGQTKQLLGAILVNMGALTEEDIHHALAAQLSIPSVDLSQIEITPAVAALLPEEFCRMHRVLPIAADEDRVTVAVANPTNVRAVDLTRGALPGRKISIVAASEPDILAAAGRLAAIAAGRESGLGAFDLAELHTLLSPRTDMRPTTAELPELLRLRSIVEGAERLIEQARRLHATHLFLEPGPAGSRIRLLVDGGMREGGELPAFAHPVVVARMKSLAGLDPAVFGVVQEGIVPPDSVPAGVEIRVSTLPTVHGERVALRLFGVQEAAPALAGLGMPSATLSQLLSVLTMPKGLVVVAGPAHSGVTTTVHAAAAEMAGMGRAVVSVEGPVERYLPGVTQVPASAETFAVMVAHARRQEARALAVGGTPDRPTAKEACEAALDCLVVLAVRGEDAASGLRALVDLGLDPCALGASLLGALGQRLLRLNCPECSRPIEVPAPTQSALRRLGPLPAGEPTFKAGGRCFACGHSGYAKAQGLFELALATPALQAALASEATERELRAVAVQDGMQPLGEQILARVWRGLTSPVEALRVGRVERFVAGPS